MTFVLEDAGHDLPDVGLIVDNKNIRRHGCFSLVLVQTPLPRPRFFSACASTGKVSRTIAPAAAARDLARVEERDRSAVLLHDLAHDGEAEAGALLARRDVGLEQLLAVLRRKTLAVVLDVDDRGARRPRDGDGDDARARRRAVRPPRSIPSRS